MLPSIISRALPPQSRRSAFINHRFRPSAILRAPEGNETDRKATTSRWRPGRGPGHLNRGTGKSRASSGSARRLCPPPPPAPLPKPPVPWPRRSSFRQQIRRSGRTTAPGVPRARLPARPAPGLLPRGGVPSMPAAGGGRAGSGPLRQRGTRRPQGAPPVSALAPRPRAGWRAGLGFVTLLSFVSRFYRLPEPPHVWYGPGIRILAKTLPDKAKVRAALSSQ